MERDARHQQQQMKQYLLGVMEPRASRRPVNATLKAMRSAPSERR